MAIVEAISFAFLAVGLLFSEKAMLLMGADPELASMAADYMKVFAVALPLFLLFFATDNYLRVCGKVRMSMNLNVLAAVLNIVLDALFLAVLGWGLWSTALATVISMCISAAASLVPFLRGTVALRFVRSGFDRREMLIALSNGLPTFFTSLSGSLYMIFANALLLAVSGDMAVSALGIMMYVNTVTGSLFSGMAAAVQPAVSYNHGAGDGKRGWDMGMALMRTCAVVGIATAALVILLNGPIVSVFVTGEPLLHEMTESGLAVFALSFLTAWASVCANQLLISVGLVRPSLAIGILSQLVLPVAVMWVMSLWGLGAVWWSFAVSAAASAVLSAAALLYARRHGAFPGLGSAGKAFIPPAD